MNLDELKTTASTLAKDPSYERFGATFYVDWINEGQLYLARMLPKALIPNLVVTHDIVVSGGTSVYDLPADYVRPESFMYGATNLYRCMPVDESMRSIIYQNSFLQPSSSRPYVYIYGLKLEIFPTPATPVLMYTKIRVVYIKRPAVLTANADIPAIDLQYHYLIAKYAASMKMIVDGMGQEGTALKGEIDVVVANLIKLYSNKGE